MFKKFCFSLILSSALIVGFSQLAMAKSTTNWAQCKPIADAQHPPYTPAWWAVFEQCLCEANGSC